MMEGLHGPSVLETGGRALGGVLCFDCLRRSLERQERHFFFFILLHCYMKHGGQKEKSFFFSLLGVFCLKLDHLPVRYRHTRTHTHTHTQMAQKCQSELLLVAVVQLKGGAAQKGGLLRSLASLTCLRLWR